KRTAAEGPILVERDRLLVRVKDAGDVNPGIGNEAAAILEDVVGYAGPFRVGVLIKRNGVHRVGGHRGGKAEIDLPATDPRELGADDGGVSVPGVASGRANPPRDAPAAGRLRKCGHLDFA